MPSSTSPAPAPARKFEVEVRCFTKNGKEFTLTTLNDCKVVRLAVPSGRVVNVPVRIVHGERIVVCPF
jgi:hypothetical protein